MADPQIRERSRWVVGCLVVGSVNLRPFDCALRPWALYRTVQYGAGGPRAQDAAPCFSPTGTGRGGGSGATLTVI